MPGEIEERTKARRLREGIDLDDTTWRRSSKRPDPWAWRPRACESVALHEMPLNKPGEPGA